jgi:hypothetical protein
MSNNPLPSFAKEGGSAEPGDSQSAGRYGANPPSGGQAACHPLLRKGAFGAISEDV